MIDLNPNIKFKKNIINNSLNDFHGNSLKKAFEKKKSLLATIQAKSLQNVLIRARFDVVSKPIAPPKILDFTTAKIKDAFYIAVIISTIVMNLNLNLNLRDAALF